MSSERLEGSAVADAGGNEEEARRGLNGIRLARTGPPDIDVAGKLLGKGARAGRGHGAGPRDTETGTGRDDRQPDRDAPQQRRPPVNEAERPDGTGAGKPAPVPVWPNQTTEEEPPRRRAPASREDHQHRTDAEEPAPAPARRRAAPAVLSASPGAQEPVFGGRRDRAQSGGLPRLDMGAVPGRERISGDWPGLDAAGDGRQRRALMLRMSVLAILVGVIGGGVVVFQLRALDVPQPAVAVADAGPAPILVPRAKPTPPPARLDPDALPALIDTQRMSVVTKSAAPARPEPAGTTTPIGVPSPEAALPEGASSGNGEVEPGVEQKPPPQETDSAANRAEGAEASLDTRPARVTTDVNMRASPANEAPALLVVPGGERVGVIGCNLWCEVTFDGRKGWIFRDFIEGYGT